MSPPDLPVHEATPESATQVSTGTMPSLATIQ